MSSIVKSAIGVGTGLVVILGVSAIAISTEGFGAWSETPWEGILASDTTYNSGFANSYTAFLVDPNKSEEWWEESWKLLSKNISNVGYKFKDVDSGYSTTNGDNALNKVCAEAYKSPEWDTKESGARANDKYDWRDIFTYCSPLRGLPSKVPANKYKPNQIGSLPPSRESWIVNWLVDLNGNYKFWKIKNNRFESYTLYQLQHDFFKTRKAQGMNLRNICK